MNKKIEIYQSDNGSIEFTGDLKNETIWANLDQISKLFKRDKSGISRHIKNIFNNNELNKNSTVAIFTTVQTDNALTVLTLLIAISNPKEKEILVKLIKHLIFYK